jgi:cellulose synthase (UDP-forming)
VVGFAFTLLLYGAELYSTAISLLGSLVNISPLTRAEMDLADLPAGTPLPTVDVLVPTYNESVHLLEVTLYATKAMRYPEGLINIYLLDDGGTLSKINDPDPVKAAAATERRAALQALCSRLKVNYIARAGNERAKAGNINNGLAETSGDLVAILDADHVPTVDFLERTVPWFIVREDVFLVQTPHFMVNPDPVDRNLLQSFRRMPSENEMFYMTIQKGLDYWSSSFFCGSAGLMRRAHLEEVGGLTGESITEDAECALDLHARGYNSIYLDRPMVAGLAPETFTGFVSQRMRWCQGMIQILLLKRPFMEKGLTWHQRLGYMSSLLFWLFPFARIIFLVVPLAYLVFGLSIYTASIAEIAAYTMPHVIATYIVSSLLFGRTRWPMVSELYEIMQCVFSLNALARVLINPRAPVFMVTPKGGTLNDDFISPLSIPFYILFGVVGFGFIGGFYRLAAYPLTRDLTVVVMLWNLFNFITLFAALGALMERRQVRSVPRMPVQESGWMRQSEGEKFDCDIADLSSGGAKLVADPKRFIPQRGSKIQLVMHSHALRRDIEIPCLVQALIPMGKRTGIGVLFEKTDDAHAQDIIALVYGDSDRWRFFQERRLRPIPFSMALGFIFSLIWTPAIMHFSMIMRLVKRKIPALRARFESVFKTERLRSKINARTA